MQVVIDIPDGYVGVIMTNQRTEGSAMDKLIRQAIIDGTPLPKGHGRLIDKDALGERLHRYNEAPYQYALKIFNESPIIIDAERRE